MNNVFTVGFFKTIWFNLRYLPLRHALKFPFLLARNTKINYCRRGFCKFNTTPKLGMVTIGFNRQFNNGLPCSLYLQGSMIVFGNSRHAFGAGSRIVIKKGATLEIGDNFGCTGDTSITVFKKISVGNNNLWSYGCVVRDNDGHSILDLDGEIQNHPKDVIFGDNIWMGCNCIVLKGSEISSDSVVAAGSRISKPVGKPFSIVTTNGVILKESITWRR